MKVSEISKRFHSSSNQRSNSGSDNHKPGRTASHILDPRRLSVGIGLSLALVAVMLVPSIRNFGPFEVSAGNNINYRVEVTNKGPDDAQIVVLTSSVPGGTTFVSEAQTSGPAFNCTTPTVGSGTGLISCTITTLPANGT